MHAVACVMHIIEVLCSLSSSLACFKRSISFRENKVILFTFPFHIFMPLTNWLFIRLQGQFPILMMEAVLISTRSHAIREGHRHLAEREILFRDSFVPF